MNDDERDDFMDDEPAPPQEPQNQSGISRWTYSLFISGLGALIGLIGYFVLPFVSVVFLSLTAYQVLTFDHSPLAAFARSSSDASSTGSNLPSDLAIFLGVVLFCLAVGTISALVLPIAPRGPSFARGLFGYSALGTGIIGFALLGMYIIPDGGSPLDFFTTPKASLLGAGFYAIAAGLALQIWGSAMLISAGD